MKKVLILFFLIISSALFSQSSNGSTGFDNVELSVSLNGINSNDAFFQNLYLDSELKYFKPTVGFEFSVPLFYTYNIIEYRAGISYEFSNINSDFNTKLWMIFGSMDVPIIRKEKYQISIEFAAGFSFHNVDLMNLPDSTYKLFYVPNNQQVNIKQQFVSCPIFGFNYTYKLNDMLSLVSHARFRWDYNRRGEFKIDSGTITLAE